MRNQDVKRRTAYCTGCDYTFEKMHLLRNHRHNYRCGGRFLSVQARGRLNDLRTEREENYRQYRFECTEAGTHTKGTNWPF